MDKCWSLNKLCTNINIDLLNLIKKFQRQKTIFEMKSYENSIPKNTQILEIKIPAVNDSTKDFFLENNKSVKHLIIHDTSQNIGNAAECYEYIRTDFRINLNNLKFLTSMNITNPDTFEKLINLKILIYLPDTYIIEEHIKYPPKLRKLIIRGNGNDVVLKSKVLPLKLKILKVDKIDTNLVKLPQIEKLSINYFEDTTNKILLPDSLKFLKLFGLPENSKFLPRFLKKLVIGHFDCKLNSHKFPKSLKSIHIGNLVFGKGANIILKKIFPKGLKILEVSEKEHLEIMKTRLKLFIGKLTKLRKIIINMYDHTERHQVILKKEEIRKLQISKGIN